MEPSSVITGDSLELLSTYFDLCVDATGVVCTQLGLLGTDLHAVGHYLQTNKRERESN